MDRYILDKMEDQKEYAIKQLFLVSKANFFKEEIASCIAYAFLDGHPSARTIAAEASLSLIDFYAILGDGERFFELWEREEYKMAAEQMNDKEEVHNARYRD